MDIVRDNNLSAITYLQVRSKEVNLFLVVAMYNKIATYSQREFDC